MLCVFHVELEDSCPLEKESGHRLDELVPDCLTAEDIACPPALGDSLVLSTVFPDIRIRGRIVMRELNIADMDAHHYLYAVRIWSFDLQPVKVNEN